MLVRVSVTFFPYCYLEPGFPSRLLSTHTHGRLQLAVQTVYMGRGARDTGAGVGRSRPLASVAETCRVAQTPTGLNHTNGHGVGYQTPAVFIIK